MVQLNDAEYMLKRKKWYSTTEVLFEIVKVLRGHELSFLSSKRIPKEQRKKAVRYLFCKQVDFLQKHFNCHVYNFFNNDLNMYMSVATLKYIPVFTYNPKKRRKSEDYQEFDNNYKNYVCSYDAFLDFDGKEDYAKCYQEAKELKKLFDEFKVPYYVIPSSPHGFHFHIPSNYMPENPIEALNTINSVIYNLSGIYNWKTLDTSVCDIKRLCKVPYSFCEGIIVLPLSDGQFENFNLDMVSVDNVFKNIKIRDRGLLIKTHELNENELKKNVYKFCSEFS